PRMISRDPCHTTRHAGPHRAVRRVEVMRPTGGTPSWSFPSARFHLPPVVLPRSALLSGLHPYPIAVAPVAWTSEAVYFRGPQSFRSPLRSALHLLRLLRPLLTSR